MRLVWDQKATSSNLVTETIFLDRKNMSNYIRMLMNRILATGKGMGYDVSQHRRYTTRYEDLCM